MNGLLDSYLNRAIIEVVLVGAFAGVVGVQVVLRRLAFFTMAMTHATFPGVVLAAVLGFNIYLGGAAAGVVVALAVVAASRRGGQGTTTATGVVLAGGFALGVVMMSARDGFTRDLTAYLVGSVLTVNGADIAVTATVGVAVVAVLAGLHKELTFGAFDPTGVRAAGYRGTALDLVVLLAVEAVVVTAVPAVGTILSVALIVAPAATARLWTDRLGATFAIAAGVGIASGLGGLAISEFYRLAAGGAITLLAAAAFAVSWVVAPYGLLRKAPALA
jgi:ABC-type Mn2+/Zn2+ transport system permease subunit